MARDGATTRTARKTDPRLWIRHALGLLSALVLLTDGTGSGHLQLSREPGRSGERTVPCGEVDCAGHASRLDAVLGVTVSVPGTRFEKAGPGDPPSSSRGRAREWGWTASRLHAEVRAVIQQFRLSAWRHRHGHLSDRPLIFTLPARGPPASA
jgi:hypothetical protein